MRCDTRPQVEESYREYHKTAFTAATVHPAEAAQEAQRMHIVVCSLVGLRPPPPPTREGPDGDGGGEGAGPAEVDGAGGRVAEEQAGGGEAVGEEEVRTIGVIRAFRNQSHGFVSCFRRVLTDASISLFTGYRETTLM